MPMYAAGGGLKQNNENNNFIQACRWMVANAAEGDGGGGTGAPE